MIGLRASLQDYLAMRRSLGFKLEAVASALLKFVQFMEDRHASHITIQLSLEWAQQPTTAQPARWAGRLSFVRGFAQYLAAIDNLTEVPPPGLFPHHPKRVTPYIYSNREIALLLAAALRLPSAGGLKRWTYYVLLGLLSVTGLRIGEALHMKLDDVDLHEGVLTVRDTKFGKSRLIPIHRSTQKVLANYLRRRRLFLAERPSAHLFISGTGNRLDCGDVHRTFYALSRQIGLRELCVGHGPRLHDFRHRFAIETLLRWYRSGEDAEPRSPALSTYLGHTSVSDTYWYLSACPELMELAAKRVDRRWRVVS